MNSIRFRPRWSSQPFLASLVAFGLVALYAGAGPHMALTGSTIIPHVHRGGRLEFSLLPDEVAHQMVALTPTIAFGAAPSAGGILRPETSTTTEANTGEEGTDVEEGAPAPETSTVTEGEGSSEEGEHRRPGGHPETQPLSSSNSPTLSSAAGLPAFASAFPSYGGVA